MSMQRHWKLQPDDIMRQGTVIPVMVIKKLEQAVPLARALVAGGIHVLEITLRTPVAMDAILSIRREVAGAIVGAGTVTRGEELAEIAEAGAVFAISPGLTAELLEAANQGPIPLIPGIATVSELMAGMALGYSHFKFFPAEAAGGVKMLQAFAGPFPQVTFCPTGGITSANYREYLGLKNVACIGGSWVAPQEAIGRGDWARITELTREAVEKSGR
ncbi:MAG: bifunctional 4-hydroxy-2-oxoglutarate aldolase/2-dehydro-3-deoxy-phosphogluconate aldolase [Desulfobacterales bacterium]